MKYIQGKNREQLVIFTTSLEEAISQDNEVRIIDEFVNSLNLSEMGFENMDVTEEGRPAYHPADLLKLYIYGYMNRTRSSRELEKETHRNIEVRWLIRELQPDHNTIANFRRDNPEAIRKVFRQTVTVAKHHNLIGGRLIAGDSVKLRAQNSKKNNYNDDKIKRHLQYIDNKINEYNSQLEKNDLAVEKKTEITTEINKQQQRREKYQKLNQQIQDSGQTQVSTSDPDSRQLIIRNNIAEVAYNTQTTVDADHKLILDFKVTNQKDTNAMSEMVKCTAEVLESNDFTALFDKGYHTGEEIKACHQMGVETLVAIPDRPSSSQAPDAQYNYDNFTYDYLTDTYTCPQGNALKSNGTWYDTKSSRFKQYRTPACKTCPVISLCTRTKRNGRVIQRQECIENVLRNQKAIEQNPQLYKKRQSIIEHTFGTIKRQWGYDHILMKKGIDRVSSDIGLIFLAYNLKRLINILGKEVIKPLFSLIFNCIEPILIHKSHKQSEILIPQLVKAFGNLSCKQLDPISY